MMTIVFFFVDNEEDFNAIDSITAERIKNHYEMEDLKKKVRLPKTCVKYAHKILSKVAGYKSLRLKDCVEVTKIYGVGYSLSIVGKGSVIFTDLTNKNWKCAVN